MTIIAAAAVIITTTIITITTETKESTTTRITTENLSIRVLSTMTAVADTRIRAAQEFIPNAIAIAKKRTTIAREATTDAKKNPDAITSMTAERTDAAK